MPIVKDQLTAALKSLKDMKVNRNFNQSVELIVKLREFDIKKPESRISESIILPNEIGKPTKVCVIAGGDLAIRAKAAGADRVISREELEELARNKKDARRLAKEYDSFIAEASLMPLVGKAIGQFLGPRGKMPIPVPPTAPIDDIIKSARRTVRIRVRDQPVIQCKVGTEEMPVDKLAENIQAVISRIEGRLEKGSGNIAGIALKTTMGPPLMLQFQKA